MIGMELSIAPLQSLGQDDSNEVQHDIFGHMMILALASASFDANGVCHQWNCCIS